MKKTIVLSIVAFCVLMGPVCFAFHVEVLQVGDITVFQLCYKGFIEELAKNDIVEGKNLTINRHIIEAQADAGLWKKVGILMRIRRAASDIIQAKPDLVLTIGTPATKYGKDKMIGNGIPVVFTGVADPLVVGCPSLDRPGNGITGSTLYIDPHNVIQIAQQALPNMKKMGMIHSDDDNAIAYAQEAKEKAAKLNVELITKEVEKSADIHTFAEEMIAQGVDAFGIPIDSYYDLSNGKATRDLVAVSHETRIPIIAFVTHTTLKGTLLYVGCNFTTVGGLAGKNAVEILCNHKKPEELSVLRQEDMTILVDPEVIKYLGVEIPLGILQLAESI